MKHNNYIQTPPHLSSHIKFNKKIINLPSNIIYKLSRPTSTDTFNSDPIPKFYDTRVRSEDYRVCRFSKAGSLCRRSFTMPTEGECKN